MAREHWLRQEFYEDISPDTKCEFIQGEVIMHWPALNRHLAASQHAYDLLGAFVRTRRLGLGRHEKAMTILPRNDYEPAVMFFGAQLVARARGNSSREFPTVLSAIPPLKSEDFAARRIPGSGSPLLGCAPESAATGSRRGAFCERDTGYGIQVCFAGPLLQNHLLQHAAALSAI